MPDRWYAWLALALIVSTLIASLAWGMVQDGRQEHAVELACLKAHGSWALRHTHMTCEVKHHG